MSEFETIDLYFKQVYTCKTHTYTINRDYTIVQLYEFITPKAYSDDFGINQQQYKIEIVEAGQFNNVNGRDAELAPALNPNATITLRDKYGDNVKNKSFYIRPKLFITIPPEPAAEDDTIPMAPRS